jgi:hypothetical protein
VLALLLDPLTPLLEVLRPGLLCDVAQRANSDPVVFRYRDDADIVAVCRVLVPRLNVATSSINDDEAVFREWFNNITPGGVA